MRTDRTVWDQPEVFAPYQAEGVVCSNELLSSAAKSSGFLNGLTDRDGLVRRFPLVIRHGDQLFPSFSLAMIATGQTWPADQVMRVEENQFAVRYLHLGKRKFPVDEQANFLVSQGDPTAILHVSAEELMLGKIDPKLFRNAVILIGSTAAGIGKIYSTPFVSAISELDLHAFFIQSLLAQKPPVRSDYFLFCEIGVTLVMLIAITCCAMLVSTLLNCACCLTGLVLIWFGATVCFQMTGYLFSPLLPSIVVVFNCSLMTSVRFYFYQKQAKEETGDVLLMLKSSETTLHSILKAVPDVVYRLDKQGKFTFLSAAIYRYTKNPEALLGQSVTHILVPDDQPEVNFRLMERRTGTRVPNGLEVRICLPESDGNHGEEIYFLIRSEGLYRDDINCPDCFLGTQGIARDITVQKKLEHQLMHAQKMEMVGNLAAGIAHDLNNVLSGLVTYPEMLMNTLDKESKMYRDMSVILKAGQMAAAIVGDLLTLARRGGNTILEPCDLNTIVDEYLSSAECLRVLHLHPQCAFKKSLAKDLKSVQGSPVHLTKVIMNIVHNAVEAMPTGGTVQISTSNCWLTEDYQGYELVQKGEYVRLEVTDPGIGIGPNEIEHVFEPFYSRKKMDKSGTGLGMTILWLTVKDHFGYIDLQSAVGKGTTVRVFLPVCSLRQENGDGGAAVKIAN
jgi:PAS domain S-box-containing protein